MPALIRWDQPNNQDIRVESHCQSHSATDDRVRQVSIAARGQAMTDLVDAARDRIGQAIFASLDEVEIAELVRLTQKFAAAMDHPTPQTPGDDAVKSDPGLTP